MQNPMSKMAMNISTPFFCNSSYEENAVKERMKLKYDPDV
jgi:hypothetical protein